MQPITAFVESRDILT